MNEDIFEGKWDQLKGEVQKTWGKLTDDDISIVKGDAKILSGVIQERYGLTKEAADKMLEEHHWDFDNKK